MRPALRAFVIVACQWESFAIVTGRVPTWTRAAHGLRRRGPIGAAVAGFVVGASVYHLLLERLDG